LLLHEAEEEEEERYYNILMLTYVFYREIYDYGKLKLSSKQTRQ
jgi:hypothetical protein